MGQFRSSAGQARRRARTAVSVAPPSFIDRDKRELAKAADFLGKIVGYFVEVAVT